MTDNEVLDIVDKMASITLAQLDANKRLLEIKDTPAWVRRAWITAIAAMFIAVAAIGTMFGTLIGKHL
jgi:capsid portal protein